MSIAILIDGRRAIPDKGLNIELTKENPAFTNADDYTLNIKFPIKDCRENAEIFGYASRHGAMVSNKPFDMEIISGKVMLKGCGIITGFDDRAVTVQYLGYRSAANYFTDLDEIKINQLDLGGMPDNMVLAKNVMVEDAWKGWNSPYKAVAIPWVNEYSGNIQNETLRIEGTDMDRVDGRCCLFRIPDGADRETYGLSWMPYLIMIAEKIAEKCGYSVDFSDWEATPYKYLIICNCVPYTWHYEGTTRVPHKWTKLLPEWSVKDFFNKLEPILEGSFIINDSERMITFRRFDKTIDRSPVDIPDVLDEFSAEVSDEEKKESTLISEKYMGYSLDDSETYRMYDCDWMIRNGSLPIKDYETLNDVTQSAAQWAANGRPWWKYQGSTRNSPQTELFRIAGGRYYCCIRYVVMEIEGKVTSGIWKGLVVKGTGVRGVPAMLNQFGPRNVPANWKAGDQPDEKIDFIPAKIDWVWGDKIVFVSISEEYEDSSTADDLTEDGEKKIYNTWPMQSLSEGEEQNEKSYFSNIAIGFYKDANSAAHFSTNADSVTPVLDLVDFDMKWHTTGNVDNGTLSLRNKFAGIPRIDTARRFEFSFLADELPSVARVFRIKGELYLCEKLTATFSEAGMSQKVKGTFRKVIS